VDIAAGLNAPEARTLTDYYYSIQGFRIEAQGQVRASEQGADEDREQFALGAWLTTNTEILEKQEAGFEELFRDDVPWGYEGSVIRRAADQQPNRPTDRQAEVLYPGELSLDFLQRLYVPGDQHRAMVLAWCDAFDQPEIEVEVNTAVFV
jgi:hypothetical protein